MKCNANISTLYFKYQEEYQEKFGDNVVVLMQIGNFYESYFYSQEKDESGNPPTWPNSKIGKAEEIAPLLNMVITRRDKGKPYSFVNCSQIGFPIVAYEKHRDVLLSHDYTIVRIDQKKNDKGEVERFVAEVLSPATSLNNNQTTLSTLSTQTTNNIVSLYIEVYKEELRKEDYLIAIGLSHIDVTTGENSVYEIYSKDQNAISAIQDAYRFILSMRPREIIVSLSYKNKDKVKDYENFLISTLELEKIPIFVVSTNKVNPEFLKVDYCSRFLTKLFCNSSINSSSSKTNINNPHIIEELGLERVQYGLTSYILLLQYCYEHNETSIERLSKPNTTYLDESRYLILEYNAQSQIDLQPPRIVNTKRLTNRNKKKINSLFDVVNYCKTALGKRYLSQRLSNPITDVTILNECYDMTEYLISNPKLLEIIQSFLKDIPDLERLQRKMYLKVISPNEFVILFKAYIAITEIYKALIEAKPLHSLLFNAKDFNECLYLVLSRYNLDTLFLCKIVDNKLEMNDDTRGEAESQEDLEGNEEPENKINIETNNLFYSGVDTQSDKYIQTIDTLRKKIDTIVLMLNTHLEKTRGKKLVYSSMKSSKQNKKVQTLGFWTTPHKATVLQKAVFPKDIIDLIGELQFINVNKEVLVTSAVIAETCQNLANLKEEYAKYLHSCYYSTLTTIAEKFNFFSTINQFISKLDFMCSNAKCAIENKYFKPVIETSDKSHKSFVDIKDMRHPIVELLIESEYITNDICLGANSQNGLLLYGINSSGKSAFLKAVALNLVLAQSGIFTPSKMTYSPYNKVITRLSGNDDLLNGDSSFVVEMKELRTILRNADDRTLVIADEICRGTESGSGTGLTVAAILTLIERGTTFLFSSHMHHLPDMLELQQVKDKLKVCHLVLKYDEKSKMLIYNRKLEEGPGNTIYGIEVALSLELDNKFIQKAYEIRNRLEGKSMFLSTRKSKYNSKIYVDACKLCGKSNHFNELETHHIKEQKDADKNGFINSSHKNIPGNLIDICEECHDRLHANGLKIISQETSKGLTLSVTK